MPYSSSLTEQEWAIIEPLLPKKKQTRPPKWSKRQLLDGVFYQLKNGCNWEDFPKDLPPYSTVFWHYKQWRVLWSVRFYHDGTSCPSAATRPKKTEMDMIDHHRLTSGQEHVQR